MKSPRRAILFIDGSNFIGFSNELRQRHLRYLVLKKEDLLKCLKD
jgi:predicted RNA-binding protein with PIN domain